MRYGLSRLLIALALAATGAGRAQAPQALVPLYSVPGTGIGTTFGFAISRSADLDGDGTADFLVGLPTFGGTGRVVALRGTDGTILWSYLTPAQAGGNFGHAVDIVGNLDGDGLPDFVVGEPQADSNSGRAHVVSTSNRVLLTTLISARSAPDDRFGNTVQAMGDVNGDAVPDFAVSASSEDPCCGHYVGTVRAYSGASQSVLWQQNGLGYFDYCGDVERSIDFNGDGVRDVLCGASEGFANSGPGYVRVYDGVNGAILLQVGGVNVNDNFGASKALVADLSGDGIPDLVASSPNGGNGLGVVDVRSGSGGGLIRQIPAPAYCAPGAFGAGAESGSLVTLPDLDGDGIAEVAVGMPHAFNSLLPGSPDTGAVGIFSCASGALLQVLWGDTAGSEFGTTLSVLDDVPQPGSKSLAVGAWAWQGVGKVYMYGILGFPLALANWATAGIGCAGSRGNPVLGSVPGSLPRFGQTFTVRISNMPITGFFVAAIPFLGFDITTSGGATLPRDLGFLGMPGCNQYVDPFQTAFLFTPTGTADWSIGIPNVGAFAGLQVHFQALVVDPPANQLGATVTNAGTATLGW